MCRAQEKQVIKNSCNSRLTFSKRVSNFSVFAHFRKETSKHLRTGTGQQYLCWWKWRAVNALSILESVTRLVSLDGFSFAFCAKNGEWRDSHLGFQVSFASPWLQWRNVLIPLRLNLLNVCVYLHHRRSKFVYFVRKLSLTMILGESWRPQGAGKKNLFQSRVNNEKGDFTTKESLTSAHILNLQRHFNTRISLPVTLTGSEKIS